MNSSGQRFELKEQFWIFRAGINELKMPHLCVYSSHYEQNELHSLEILLSKLDYI